MGYLGVGGLGAMVWTVADVLAQSIRVAEPWTRETRMGAIGLILIAGVGAWALIRVRRDR